VVSRSVFDVKESTREYPAYTVNRLNVSGGGKRAASTPIREVAS
jgi:hypothetical protein